jgi:hypothetical protein
LYVILVVPLLFGYTIIVKHNKRRCGPIQINGQALQGKKCNLNQNKQIKTSTTNECFTTKQKKWALQNKNVDAKGEANIKWQQSTKSKAQMDIKHNLWCKPQNF